MSACQCQKLAATLGAHALDSGLKRGQGYRKSLVFSVCQLSADLCLSYGRTKEDIRKWKRMKRPEKVTAVQRASLRLKSLQKRNA
jgi:predicted Fe-S protein YdhL (DUF1289 family)